jgi:hypothetical protein
MRQLLNDLPDFTFQLIGWFLFATVCFGILVGQAICDGRNDKGGE